MIRMQIVEDFNIESEIESDGESVTSINSAALHFTITAATAADPPTSRRVSTSAGQIELAEGIKEEIIDHAEEVQSRGIHCEELAVQGSQQDRLMDWTKREPPDEYTAVREGQAAAEMCWVYETLAEVKPPPGILPLPPVAADGDARFITRMFYPRAFYFFVFMFVFLLFVNKRCENKIYCPLIAAANCSFSD
jgi:hypothetical protein